MTSRSGGGGFTKLDCGWPRLDWALRKGVHAVGARVAAGRHLYAGPSSVPVRIDQLSHPTVYIHNLYRRTVERALGAGLQALKRRLHAVMTLLAA